jgi:hypothetical protein
MLQLICAGDVEQQQPPASARGLRSKKTNRRPRPRAVVHPSQAQVTALTGLCTESERMSWHTNGIFCPAFRAFCWAISSIAPGAVRAGHAIAFPAQAQRDFAGTAGAVDHRVPGQHAAAAEQRGKIFRQAS